MRNITLAIWRAVAIVLLTIVFVGCSSTDPAPPQISEEPTQVPDPGSKITSTVDREDIRRTDPSFLSMDNDGFVRSGEPIVLKGFNYVPRVGPVSMDRWPMEEIDQDLAAARSLGANVIRIFINYQYSTGLPDAANEALIKENYEPTKSYLEAIRTVLRLADQHHLLTIITLFDYAPGFLFFEGGDLDTPKKYLNGLIPHFTEDPRIAAWDILNEGDRLPGEFPTLEFGQVQRFLRAMSSEIRRLDPNHLVTANFSDVDQAWQSSEYVDFVSFSYYGDQAVFGEKIRSLRTMLGQRQVPLVASELGHPTSGISGATTEEQAVRLAANLDLAINLEPIAGTLVWTLADFDVGRVPPGEPATSRLNQQDYFYGVFDKDLRPKQSAAVVKRFFMSRCDTQQRTEIHLSNVPEKPPEAGDPRLLQVFWFELAFLSASGEELLKIDFGADGPEKRSLGHGWYGQEQPHGQWSGSNENVLVLCAAPTGTSAVRFTVDPHRDGALAKIVVGGQSLGQYRLSKGPTDYITAGPIFCGDGRIDGIVEDFEGHPLEWSFWGSDQGKAAAVISRGAGCSGDYAIAVEYDLGGGYAHDGSGGADWLIVRRDFDPPIEMTAYSHLRLAVRSSTAETHHNLQVKLVTSDGSIYLVTARSVTDITVWRPIYFDLREFRCQVCPEGTAGPDLSRISGLEIGIARCIDHGNECEPGSNAGTLYLDEFAGVDLTTGGKYRAIQTQAQKINLDPDVRSAAANAILIHQDENGLVPAWFGEEIKNYNTYTQALALIVFVSEAQRTGNPAYADAANRLAAQLLALQIPEGRTNGGSWYTAYKPVAGNLISFGGSCTGNEKAVQDIDRCSWAGNTAWAVMSLALLRDSGIYNEGPHFVLLDSIHRGASWLAAQAGRIEEFAGVVSIGMEGNISTYFALAGSGPEWQSDADRLAIATYRFGWDPVEMRMKIGAGPFDYAAAMDTAGSWGAQFLRCIGRDDDALASQGFAASILSTTSFDARNRARTVVGGYGDIAGPWTMTVEFGAQGSAAGILRSNQVMQHIYSVQADDGSFPGSTDDWYGGTVAPWTTTMNGVAPTAWVYFAQNGDPLLGFCSWNIALSGVDKRTAPAWQ